MYISLRPRLDQASKATAHDPSEACLHLPLISSRYWLARSVTIASSGFSFMPKAFSTFEELDKPGLDRFLPSGDNIPALTASGNFFAAILGTSSQMISFAQVRTC